VTLVFIHIKPTLNFGAEPVGKNISETYFNDCAEKMGMGRIPQVDCIRDGSIIPITVDGKEVESAGEIPRCDKPQILNGECYPYSRIINLSKGDVDTVILCRRTHFGPKDERKFDDIAIIQRNRKTKKACFFQAFSRTKSIATISLPYEVKQDKNDPNAWAGGIGCMDCHSANAWIHTPYINQVKGTNAVPWDPFQGKTEHTEFKLANEAICINKTAYDFKFPPSNEQKKQIEKGRLAASNACTACHQTGGKQYYDLLVKYATSENPRRVHLTDWAQEFSPSHWMPPKLPRIPDEVSPFERRPIKNALEYNRYYARALEAVERCAANPSMTVEMNPSDKKLLVPVCQGCDETSLNYEPRSNTHQPNEGRHE
jgi:hypothetical protein